MVAGNNNPNVRIGEMIVSKTKVVKVKASEENWWFRRIGQAPTEKKLEQEINEWQKKGYKLLNTVPVTDRKGKVTAYMLTFEQT